MALNVASAVVGYATLLIIARFLNPESLGMVAFGLGLVGMGAFLSNLGWNAAHIKHLAQEHDEAACWGTFLRMRRRLVMGFMVVAAVLATGWHITFGFTDATSYPIVLICIVAIGFQQFRSLATTGFEAQGQAARLHVPGFVETSIRGVLTVAVALLVSHATTGIIGLALAVTYLVGAFASWAWARSRAPWPALTVHQPELARSYWKFALPVMLAGMVATINVNVDKVVIGYFWNAAEVGQYFAAQRLAQFLHIIPAGLGALMFPIIAQLTHAGTSVRDVARTAHRTMTLFLLPLVAVFIAFPDSIIRIALSNQYQDAALLVAGFAVHALLAGLITLRIVITNGKGLIRWTLAASLAGAVSNLILNIALVPESIGLLPLGALKGEGAMIGTLGAAVIQMLVLSMGLRRADDGALFHVRDAWHLLCAGLAILPFQQSAVIAFFGDLERVWHVGAASAALCLIYVGLLALVREFGRKEIRFLIETLHIPELARYLRSETRRS